MQIRLGYELIYQCGGWTPMILLLHVHPSRAPDLAVADTMVTDPPVPLSHYQDGFGNRCTRLLAPSGRIRISADALISDPGVPEPVVPDARQHGVDTLPEETLVFLLGSRYCDTDRLSELAWARFGHIAPGWRRVQAICDFLRAPAARRPRHSTSGVGCAAISHTSP